MTDLLMNKSAFGLEVTNLVFCLLFMLLFGIYVSKKIKDYLEDKDKKIQIEISEEQLNIGGNENNNNINQNNNNENNNINQISDDAIERIPSKNNSEANQRERLNNDVNEINTNTNENQINTPRIIVNRRYILDKLEEEFLIYYVYTIAAIVIAAIVIIPIILIAINIHKNPFNDSLFKDLKLNYKMSPITEIEISEKSTLKEKEKASYFNNLKPYNLGKIVIKNGEEEILSIWKKKHFYVTRMDKKYTYPYIKKSQKEGYKKCGKDSKGNSLYFPENEHCPINYIEFNNNENPPTLSDSKLIRFTSKKINSDTYMHYTNDYIDGEILVHLQISALEYPIGDTNTYNSICYEKYNKSVCKYDNNYNGYEGDSYGYKKIDDNINNTYLFKRTYAGIKEDKNLGNHIFNVHSLIFGTHIYSLLYYFLIFFIIVCMVYFYVHIEKDYLTFYFSFGLALSSFITFILIILSIVYVDQVRTKIFKNSELDIRHNYNSFPTFLKLDIGILCYSISLLILGIIMSIIAVKKNKSCFTYTNLYKIEYFISEYEPVNKILVLLIFVFIILFPSLLLSHNLFSEGYVDYITENWKKTPITKIEFSQTENNDNKIGTFKNFKNEKSIDIYNWKGGYFIFTRKPGNYYYNKIIQNKEKEKEKVKKNPCGLDSEGNPLYFLKGEDCPINEVKLTDSTDPPDAKYKEKDYVQIGNKYLHYTNESVDGFILVDFKVSDIKGPCLNKKKNNELCKFFLEKCNLKQKDYVCDAYKTKNGINIEHIDSDSFTNLIKYNNLNKNNEFYDTTSEVYLYYETYIGHSNSTKKFKQSGELYNIKKIPKVKNVFLFFSMFLFIFLGIGFIHFVKNYKKTIVSAICLIIFLFSLTCFILSALSIGLYNKNKKNILKKFANELSDYYKFRWEVVIEVFNMNFYMCSFLIFLYLLWKYLEEDDYKLIKKFKCNIPTLDQIIKLRRKPEIYFFIGTFLLFSLIPFILCIVLLTKKDFSDGYIKDIRENWNKPPIYNIKSTDKNSVPLGSFNGIKDKTYSPNNTEVYFTKFRENYFEYERKDNKFNYPYIFKNQKENTKKCGVDSKGNGLYFPDNEDCPINYISINQSPTETNIPNCKNIPLDKNNYLHYSNEYFNGQILVDFKISTRESPCTDANYDNDICQHFETDCLNVDKKNCKGNDENMDDYLKIDETDLKHLFSENDIKINEGVYENKKVYLFARTYKGLNRNFIENISKTKNLLNSIINIKNYSKGKNVYLVIIHFIFIILLGFNFYFFDEEEKKFEKFLYGFSLFIVVCIIINISLCSHIIRMHNLFKNYIFKFIDTLLYEEYKKFSDFETLNLFIILFDILLMLLVIYWFYYYYTHRLTFVPKRYGIIRFFKNKKNLVIIFNFLFTIIIIILILVLLSEGEYNDPYFKGLEKNWKKKPIFKIGEGDEFIFNTFKGTKNKGYGDSKKEEKLYYWRNNLKITLDENNKKYTDFLKKGSKLCGYDSKKNEMRSDNDCPINDIQIKSYEDSSLTDYTKVNFGDYYIYYTNKKTDGKILTDFKISHEIPSFKLNTDNSICTLIDGKCNLDAKNLIYNNNEKDEIYEQIDEMKLSDFISKNTNLKLNPQSYDGDTKIKLYKETYVGKNPNGSISHILKIRNFSRDKNIVLFIFTFIYLIILFFNFEFISYDYGLYGFIIYSFVHVLLFINLILVIVSVSYYHTISSNIRKYNDIIKEEYNSTKWHCKINICLIIFYIIDIAIGGLNYYFLLKKEIISFNRNIERRFETYEPRTYQPKEIEIYNQQQRNLVSHTESQNEEELKQQLKELRNIEKDLLTKIDELKKFTNSEDFENLKHEIKTLEDDIEILEQDIERLTQENERFKTKINNGENEKEKVKNEYKELIDKKKEEVEEETKKVKEQNEKNEKIEKEYQLKIQQLYDDRNKLNEEIIELREVRKNMRKKN